VNQPLDAGRQVERLPGFEAFDVFEHVPRVRLDRGLAQPGQPVVLPLSRRLSRSSRRRRCASDSGSAKES
jgi:hypothetical protein